MAAAIGIAKTATEIFLGVGQVSIDNFTFRLFYKWSVTLFIVCSVLVCTSQFFGDPVQCETVTSYLCLSEKIHHFKVLYDFDGCIGNVMNRKSILSRISVIFRKKNA